MKRLLILLLLCLGPVMTAMAVGKIAFSLPDTNGKVHTLSQYAGKWVIVNYWATYCPPCIKEIPQLMKFHEKHKDHDAVVLGVNYEDISLAWLKDFMDSISMSYPVLRSDPSQQVTPFGAIIMLPTTFIISPGGELVAQQAGAVTAADLEAFIKRQSEAGKANAPATKLNTKIH
jgi:thiol-disulfide isomerase/thioredoxin